MSLITSTRICAEGTVDQVGADYIGLKVLGGLVAVIHEDELQRKLRYSDTVRLFSLFWTFLVLLVCGCCRRC